MKKSHFLLIFIISFSCSAYAQKNNNLKTNTIDTSIFITIPGRQIVIKHNLPYILINKEDLLKVKNIECSNNKYQIISFDISVHSVGDFINIHNKGNEFSQQSIDYIKNNLSIGIKVFIEYVYLISPTDSLTINSALGIEIIK